VENDEDYRYETPEKGQKPYHMTLSEHCQAYLSGEKGNPITQISKELGRAFNTV
jgi:hypothetical protein